MLIAIAFALIGLAVLFRNHDAPPGTTHWLPTPVEFKLVLAALLICLLFVLAAFLGSWCGYLRVAFRLRKLSKTDNNTKDANVR